MLTFLLGLVYAISTTAWVATGHHPDVANLMVSVWLVATFGGVALIRQAQYVHLRRVVLGSSPAENDQLL